GEQQEGDHIFLIKKDKTWSKAVISYGHASATWNPIGAGFNTINGSDYVFQGFELLDGESRIDLVASNIEKMTVLEPDATEPKTLTVGDDSDPYLWFNVQKESGNYTYTVVTKTGVTYTVTLTWTAPKPLQASATGKAEFDMSTQNIRAEYQLLDGETPLNLSSYSKLYRILPDATVEDLGAPDTELTNLWFSSPMPEEPMPEQEYSYLLLKDGIWYSSSVNFDSAEGTIELTDQAGVNDGFVYVAYKLMADDVQIPLTDANIDYILEFYMEDPDYFEDSIISNPLPDSDPLLWFNVEKPKGYYLYIIAVTDGSKHVALLRWQGVWEATLEPTGNEGIAPHDGNLYKEYEMLDKWEEPISLAKGQVTFIGTIGDDGKWKALEPNTDETLWFNDAHPTFYYDFIVANPDGIYRANLEWIKYTDQVYNGGFETGNFKGWLVKRSGIYPQVQGNTYSEGQYASFMGDGADGMYGEGDSGLVWASIAQYLSIADNGDIPMLSLNYRFNNIGHEYSDPDDPYDYLNVIVNDGSEEIEIARWYATAEDGDSGWQNFSHDLSAYKGQTIELKIESWTTDASYEVDYYVDNVRLSYEPVPPELESVTAVLGGVSQTVFKDEALQAEFGQTVGTITATLTEEVTMAEGADGIIYIQSSAIPAGTPYGTFTVSGNTAAITPYPGNAVLAKAGTFTFTVPAGQVVDVDGHANNQILFTLEVSGASVPDLVSVTAELGGTPQTAPKGEALTAEVGQSVGTITAELTENVTLIGTTGVITISGGTIPAGTPYGTFTVSGKTATITPNPGNAVLGQAGTFTFTVPAGQVKDADLNPNLKITFTLIVSEASLIPDLVSVTAVIGGETKTALKGQTLDAEVNKSVGSITAELTEPATLTGAEGIITMAGGPIASGTPYGTFAIDGTAVTIIPYPGNDVLGYAGTFTFTVAAGQIQDADGQVNPEINFTMEVAPAEVPDLVSVTAVIGGETKTALKGETLDAEVNKSVGSITAELTEPATLTGAEGIITMAGGPIPAGTPYGTFAIDGTAVTITPYPGNDVLGYAGIFTFTVAAGQIEDADGNVNPEINFTMDVIPAVVPDLYSVTAVLGGVSQTVSKDEALQAEFGQTVGTITATLTEEAELIGTGEITISGGMIPAGTPYGTFTVNGDEAIITPYTGNDALGNVGTFTFTVAAGQIQDADGNVNEDITFTLEVVSASVPDFVSVTAEFDGVPQTGTSLSAVVGQSIGAITVKMTENVELIEEIPGEIYISGDGITGEILFGIFTANGDELVITPEDSFDAVILPGSFILRIASGQVRDADLNLNPQITFTFEAAPDTAPPGD
ncbi:MAG: hypothetical protein GX808_13020, partial [Syntrophomonadaceae bacterium]|nr:hypothetical protein [Syntrophomonadaceae bacterium]